MIFRAEITIPPSVNNAYFNVRGRGRVPSTAHTAWKKTAGWEIKLANPPRLHGGYRFAIELPMNMRGDVDGRVKLPMDLLVELGVTPDDRKAISAHAERKECVPKGRCFVEVRSVEAA